MRRAFSKSSPFVWNEGLDREGIVVTRDGFVGEQPQRELLAAFS